MTVGKLIELLRAAAAQLPEGTGAEVMILDSFNGGGAPREILLGPVARTITQADVDETADCEERLGENVLVLGYGSY